MSIQIHLYGKKKNVTGWEMLFDQEKVPYLYKGTKLEKFSLINVLVGFELKAIPKNSRSVFIIEPTISQVVNSKYFSIMDSFNDSEIGEIKTYGYVKMEKLKGEYLGTFKTHQIHNDDLYPVTTIKKNKIIFHCNLSQQLSLYGFTNNLIAPDAKGNMIYAHFSPVNKAGSIRFLRKTIIKAFSIAGLPYIHIWYYPTKQKSVFLFRQDVDYVDLNAMEKIYGITKKYHIKGTYFVNIDGGEEYDQDGPMGELSKPTTPQRSLVLFKLLKDGNELANHGYVHTVEGDIIENLRNIKRCSEVLLQLFNIKNKGYASPGGIYTIPLANAIDKSDMEYACNGCLGSDGFPYYPNIGRKKVKTLEIPFHLACDGFFEPFTNKFEQSFIHRELLTYINRQLTNYEPIALMGHPHLAGKIADKFYPKIFDKIKKNRIPTMTILEFARWWKKRQSLNFTYSFDGKSLDIIGSKGTFVEIIEGKKRKIIQLSEKKIYITNIQKRVV